MTNCALKTVNKPFTSFPNNVRVNLFRFAGNLFKFYNMESEKLDEGNNFTIRGKELTIEGDDFTLRGIEITIRGALFTVRGNGLTIRGNVFTLRGNELTIRGDELTP